MDHNLYILSKFCRYTASEDPTSTQIRHVPSALRHALREAPLPVLKCTENKIYSSLVFILLITRVLRRVLSYTARKQRRWVRNQLVRVHVLLCEQIYYEEPISDPGCPVECL